ncbi:putative endonuclease [Methylohalomonas lacus]|uniref:Endonuclease n=1 Tax=Methylohalomonas lacus TaxID=398773 RepID=A0AAE3L0W8_9GAMM|nr:putative endonuclease [Methylohalomonas lacus]
MATRDWHLYLIRTDNGTLYTGITTDVERRLAEHQQGGRLAARYLRANLPVELVYSVAIGSRSLATRLEWAVKQLPKSHKEAIVSQSPDSEALRALLKIPADSNAG